MQTKHGWIGALILGTTIAAALPAVAGAEEAEAAVLREYGAMHSALAADSAEGVSEGAARIAAIAGKAEGPTAGAFRALAEAAGPLRGDDLEALREEFKEFSKAMATFVNEAGVAGAQLYYCPMAKGYWIQDAGDEGVRNPYYGKSMLKCGSKVDEVEG